MPRGARLVLPGLPHHLTHRGNNRQEVFRDEEDRLTYLALLRHYAPKHGLKVLGYCLMTNHVHLAAVPEREDSLARAMGCAHLRYAQAFNWRYGECGHRWQGRFYSCALDDSHLIAALRYVERNPVRAGMTARAWEYGWSSAAAHLGDRDPSGLLDVREWQTRFWAAEWRRMLSEPEEEGQLRAIRLQTRTGRPLGSQGFLERLEILLGRHLGARPVGRPRRKTAEGDLKSEE